MKIVDPVAGAQPSLERVDFILVVGRTGAGKTTFINTMSGSNFAVGDDLLSCRKEMNFSKPIPYKAGNRLIGVLYMVNVSTDKMSHSDVIDIEAFREMVGSDAMKNVVIVTNKWGALTSHEVGERRVKQLLDHKDFFAQACEDGASVWHLKHKEDTRKLVEDILTRNMPVTLQIQREVVDEKRSLIDTAAGNVVGSDLDRKTKEVQHRLAKLKQSKQRDEQSQQAGHGDDGPRGIGHPINDVDKSYLAEQDRRRRKLDADIRALEDLEEGLKKIRERMNQNSEQLWISSPGKKAAMLIGGLIALGLACAGSMAMGNMLVNRRTAAQAMAVGALFIKQVHINVLFGTGIP